MKGIKKLNVNIPALLLAGAMSLSFAGCSTVDMKDITPSALVDIQDVKDSTLLDELVEQGRLMYSEKLNVVEAATKLERLLNILDLLKSVDFKDVESLQPLSNEESEKVLSFSDEQIKELIDQSSYKGKEVLLLEKKLTALKQLDYLRKYSNEWIKLNGASVSEKFMISAVKASVADEFGLSVDQYDMITIMPCDTNNSNSYNIQVGDTMYHVPMSASEIWDTMDYTYKLQTAVPTEETLAATCRKALNYGKITIAAGSNVKKDTIVEQYDSSSIKKNYVNH